MATKRYNIRNDKALSALLDGLRRMKQPFNIAISDGEKRSIDQNRRMWAMLNEVSQKARHHGVQYAPEDWKTLFMLAMGKEMRMAPSLDANCGIVPLSVSTSEMTISEMSDLMEFMSAWCAENGVTLTDPRYGDVT